MVVENSRAVVAKTVSPMEEVRGAMFRLRPEFKKVLPAHVSEERFERVALTAIQQDPKILTANRQSLYSACLESATDGLVPDGREAALVVFGSEVVYLPMVAGICKMARNSGEISCLDAVVVREKDQYRSWVDEKGPHFLHEKSKGDRGEPIMTYAYAITKDGGIYIEEIDMDQMAAIEKTARSSAAWKGPFREEFFRKSAIHRLLKYRVPSSSDLDGFIKADIEKTSAVPAEPTPPEPPVTSSRLSKIVSQQDPLPETPPAAKPTQAALPAEQVPI